VRRVIVHEQYNADKGENDIALLELATPAKSTPVAYARPGMSTLESSGKAVVTGWGQLRETTEGADGRPVDPVTGELVTAANWNQYFSEKLRQVELPLITWQSCRDAYARRSSRVIDARTVCAAEAEGGKDSCQGDSGGPLVARDSRNFYVQVGVVSWGFG